MWRTLNAKAGTLDRPLPAAPEQIPWYDLALMPISERAPVIYGPNHNSIGILCPKIESRLAVNCNLYDIWALRQVHLSDLLWAVLNSTVTVLSKHQFGRAAGIEGNLKTEVVDVNMMLVPDIRRASPEAAAQEQLPPVSECRKGMHWALPVSKSLR